jgi:hypothetical protein
MVLTWYTTFSRYRHGLVTHPRGFENTLKIRVTDVVFEFEKAGVPNP